MRALSEHIAEDPFSFTGALDLLDREVEELQELESSDQGSQLSSKRNRTSDSDDDSTTSKKTNLNKTLLATPASLEPDEEEELAA